MTTACDAVVTSATHVTANCFATMRHRCTSASCRQQRVEVWSAKVQLVTAWPSSTEVAVMQMHVVTKDESVMRRQ